MTKKKSFFFLFNQPIFALRTEVVEFLFKSYMVFQNKIFYSWEVRMIYNFFDLSSVIFLQVAPTYMMSRSSIDHQLGDKRH